MIQKILERRLRRMKKKKCLDAMDNDYSDCGFPIFHMERDLHLTYHALLKDENMRKKSHLSKETYTLVVKDYYDELMRDFNEEYYH